jgi:hypothetical protein
MVDFARLKVDVLVSGSVGEREVECICRQLYRETKLDREVVEFLVDVHRAARTVCPLFERLLTETIEHNVLDGGSITAEGAAWLRRLFIADGAKKLLWHKKLLWQLKRESEYVSPEFRQLYDECVG